MKTSLTDDIRLDHGTRRIVEKISSKDDLYHHYAIDTNNSGLYEIKILSNPPDDKSIELFKNQMLA